MKYLGIDFGTKRVGLSTSDEEGRLAFPYKVVANDQNLIKTLEQIVEEEQIEAIVVGESKDFKGEPNTVMVGVEALIVELKAKLKKPIYLEPEFMTSAQAERLQPRNRGLVSRPERRESKSELIDASAATIILQSYIDRQ